MKAEFPELFDNRAEKRHVRRILKIDPYLAATESPYGWFRPKDERF